MKALFSGMAGVFAALLFPAMAFADAAIPDIWERDSTLVWVLVIAVVLIAAAVLILVLRKRKK
ncbi:MAG: hypothetical protein IKD70_06050 [Eggerthellaceae bacterium]|nr:hypothetical protein [Eggerthellaceae bacterium]